MNKKGGTRGVLDGDLKRRADSITIATVGFGEPGSGLVNIPVTVRGLSSVLGVWVGVSVVEVTDEGNQVPLPASQCPAGMGTLQITPQSNFPDSGKGLFRPLFQDPTATDNGNHPLPQDLPFSWNFPGECDEAVCDIVLDSGAWAGFGRGGFRIMFQCMVEYDGNWWDVNAIELAFGQAQVSPPSKPLQLFAS